jgi:hypothetical protein
LCGARLHLPFAASALTLNSRNYQILLSGAGIDGVIPAISLLQR